MHKEAVDAALSNLKGGTFVGMDTETVPTLKGGKSGYVQCTSSIGYGWSVYEAGDKAVLMYMDGGMGWDTVTMLGKNKQALEEMRQTGIALGMVKLRKTG